MMHEEYEPILYTPVAWPGESKTTSYTEETCFGYIYRRIYDSFDKTTTWSRANCSLIKSAGFTCEPWEDKPVKVPEMFWEACDKPRKAEF